MTAIIFEPKRDPCSVALAALDTVGLSQPLMKSDIVLATSETNEGNTRHIKDWTPVADLSWQAQTVDLVRPNRPIPYRGPKECGNEFTKRCGNDICDCVTSRRCGIFLVGYF